MGSLRLHLKLEHAPWAGPGGCSTLRWSGFPLPGSEASATWSLPSLWLSMPFVWFYFKSPLPAFGNCLRLYLVNSVRHDNKNRKISRGGTVVVQIGLKLGWLSWERVSIHAAGGLSSSGEGWEKTRLKKQNKIKKSKKIYISPCSGNTLGYSTAGGQGAQSGGGIRLAVQSK